ncbi:MAG TPA: glycosyltransferase family 2 protein [Solirubrobacterales bacterium]|nr:glycosyltransferase family 2 protein [Solirubrobacterales bacterium]
MRVVALLATYNERRFIEGCLGHLDEQGVDVYLIDNASTDGTVALAEPWLERNLLGIETFPREDGVYNWRALLQRKEEVAEQLTEEREAGWLIHLDPDEVRLAPPGDGTLAEALARVERDGYNAVNFLEYTFVPSREQPDHDHPEFQRTLHTYYPFGPFFPHQLKAWKAADAPTPDLASSGGHRVSFRGLRMYPQSFPMKHYLFLSVPHAIEKYVERDYDPREVRRGWHGWRAELTARDISLPSESELRVSRSDDDLDPSTPRKSHCIDRVTIG